MRHLANLTAVAALLFGITATAAHADPLTITFDGFFHAETVTPNDPGATTISAIFDTPIREQFSISIDPLTVADSVNNSSPPGLPPDISQTLHFSGTGSDFLNAAATPASLGTLKYKNGANGLDLYFLDYANANNGRNIDESSDSVSATLAVNPSNSPLTEQDLINAILEAEASGTVFSFVNYHFSTLLDDSYGVSTYLNGSAFIVSTSAAPIDAPEPTTLGLLGMGMAGLGAIRRRRKETA